MSRVENKSRHRAAQALSERPQFRQGNCDWCQLWDGRLVEGLCAQCAPKFKPQEDGEHGDSGNGN